MLCSWHFHLLSIVKFPAQLPSYFASFELYKPEPDFPDDILLSFSIHNVTVSMYVHILQGAPF